jgi:hypothetical protein
VNEETGTRADGLLNQQCGKAKGIDFGGGAGIDGAGRGK